MSFSHLSPSEKRVRRHSSTQQTGLLLKAIAFSSKEPMCSNLLMNYLLVIITFSPNCCLEIENSFLSNCHQEE